MKTEPPDPLLAAVLLDGSGLRDATLRQTLALGAPGTAGTAGTTSFAGAAMAEVAKARVAKRTVRIMRPFLVRVFCVHQPKNGVSDWP